jgi:hypothetical protein
LIGGTRVALERLLDGVEALKGEGMNADELDSRER